MEEKNCKIVRNAGVARKLLKLNCVIVDIKKDKEDESGKKSVFVFKKDEHFDNMFGQLNEEIQAARAAE